MFDIGCQQHGNYVGIEQPDEKNEEEEAAPSLIPKWKAGDISEIKLEPEEDDLGAEAENTEQNAAGASPGWCSNLFDGFAYCTCKLMTLFIHSYCNIYIATNKH